MSPPLARPIPRFLAEPPHEALPYGRWAELLGERFLGACERVEDLPAGAGAPESVTWFPERGWNGRIYVPAVATAAAPPPAGGGAGPARIEYFGHVSFERPEGGEPAGFAAAADFTDVTADLNPEWTIDLNDELIGAWRGEEERAGSVTLVWGTALVPGAAAATAELDGEVVDQAAVEDGRFTLVALDAVHGFGDDLYLEIRLWNRRGDPLATESLYE